MLFQQQGCLGIRFSKVKNRMKTLAEIDRTGPRRLIHTFAGPFTEFIPDLQQGGESPPN